MKTKGITGGKRDETRKRKIREKWDGMKKEWSKLKKTRSVS